MIKAYYKILFLAILFFSTQIYPQLKSDSVKAIINKEYEANAIHNLIFGKHWRDVWISEFEIPILNLNKFAGGLTPIKLGGGQQTKSLQFTSKDGKIYKFRSVDKFPGRSLPDDLKGSVVESFMQDQITTLHPFSATVTSSLMDACGVLHPKPQMYKMPDDDRLSDYKDEFKNMIGTIEEKAEEYDDKSLNFASADKIRNTFKMFDELQEDNDNSVDAHEFLKARLFDIFIGDRDRHAGQWDWAEYKKGKKKNFIPIPKDRDFAFPLYDGLIPRILTLAITSYVHFDYNMPSMLDLTWEGRHLDRRILTKLSKSEWDSVAKEVYDNLTDEQIDKSIQLLPENIYKVSGEELSAKLKSRRNQLLKASQEFYELVNKYPDFYLSDKNEFIIVERVNDSSTELKIFRAKKDKFPDKSDILFHKMFDHSITEEIRIHLLGGDDKAMVKGTAAKGILIVIDGGEGQDELIDSSIVNSLKSKTKFYDSDLNTEFKASNNTYINTKNFPAPKDDSEKYEPKQEDRYYDFGLLFPTSLSSDYGLKIGLGGGFNFYDFKIFPYSYRLEAAASYSYLTESAEIYFNSFFNQLIEDWKIKLSLRATQLNITRFNGLGNETNRDENLNEQKFYQVDQSALLLGIQFTKSLNDKIHFSIEIGSENSIIKEKQHTFLYNNNFYGEGNLSFGYLGGIFIYDSRDDIGFPYKGYFVEVSGIFNPKIFNLKNQFGSLKVDLRSYFENNFITQTTLSLRVAAEQVFGNYPFYKGASLGGSRSLIGYPKNRYVGDASVLTQAEVKMYLGKPRIIIPGKFGLTLFSETGRVFLKGENSKKWHSSVGGGFYFDIFERLLTINFDVAFSKEYVRFYLSFSNSI